MACILSLWWPYIGLCGCGCYVQDASRLLVTWYLGNITYPGPPVCVHVSESIENHSRPFPRRVLSRTYHAIGTRGMLNRGGRGRLTRHRKTLKVTQFFQSLH